MYGFLCLSAAWTLVSILLKASFVPGYNFPVPFLIHGHTLRLERHDPSIFITREILQVMIITTQQSPYWTKLNSLLGVFPNAESVFPLNVFLQGLVWTFFWRLMETQDHIKKLD